MFFLTLRSNPSISFVLNKTGSTYKEYYLFYLAQGEGFEPSWLLAKRFSRPPRYDRFDTPAYINALLSLRIYVCRDFSEAALKTRYENPLRMLGEIVCELAHKR